MKCQFVGKRRTRTDSKATFTQLDSKLSAMIVLATAKTAVKALVNAIISLQVVFKETAGLPSSDQLVTG